MALETARTRRCLGNFTTSVDLERISGAIGFGRKLIFFGYAPPRSFSTLNLKIKLWGCRAEHIQKVGPKDSRI